MFVEGQRGCGGRSLSSASYRCFSCVFVVNFRRLLESFDVGS